MGVQEHAFVHSNFILIALTNHVIRLCTDFGCYYHECFLRGHPRLTVLMRRASSGQGKVTPNMHSEPDFYLIAQQYSLETPADVPDRDDKRVVSKVAKASVSGRQKSQCPGDSDVGDEASGYKEDDDPLMTRKAAEPGMDGMSNQHQWDPFDQEIDSAHLHHQEAAPRAGINQFFSMRSQSHSFASGGAKESESNAQAAMNYDPFPYQQQSGSGSYRDRGYSDPSPMPNHRWVHKEDKDWLKLKVTLKRQQVLILQHNRTPQLKEIVIETLLILFRFSLR
ncbi:hypothetical protein QTG54_015552 [Skeletonema marinoi]|uniref:Uncharacterized protein n=1 Tax=Skeletonema marinoi TaxID=267567 RepID=A0AAD8XU02_9STRA|nr:hypothetical protein QTG54_015552 [Skeletonema marinoi]